MSFLDFLNPKDPRGKTQPIITNQNPHDMYVTEENVLRDYEADFDFEDVRNAAYQSVGRSQPDKPILDQWTQYDRFRSGFSTLPDELVGHTFISKPELNLSEAALSVDPCLSILRGYRTDTAAWMIRSNLDSIMSRGQGVYEGKIESVNAQSFVSNNKSPFILPLQNALASMTGWPEASNNLYQSQPGMFQETQTFPTSSSFGNETTHFNLSFFRGKGNIVRTMIYLWIRWAALLNEGEIKRHPAPSGRWESTLDHSCSIYRFPTGPDGYSILGTGKVTGGFFNAINMSGMFDFQHSDTRIPTAPMIETTFIGNHVDQFNPQIAVDFNLAIKEFNPEFDPNSKTYIDCTVPFKYGTITYTPQDLNFMATPYIDTLRMELHWYVEEAKLKQHPYSQLF